jgi:hypothetical protein
MKVVDDPAVDWSNESLSPKKIFASAENSKKEDEYETSVWEGLKAFQVIFRWQTPICY